MNFKVEPLVLKGQHLRLEPLSQEHANGLFNRGRQEEDWLYMPRPAFVDLADCRHWIEEAAQTAGHVAWKLAIPGLVATGRAQS